MPNDSYSYNPYDNQRSTGGARTNGQYGSQTPASMANAASQAKSPGDPYAALASLGQAWGAAIKPAPSQDLVLGAYMQQQAPQRRRVRPGYSTHAGAPAPNPYGPSPVGPPSVTYGDPSGGTTHTPPFNMGNDGRTILSMGNDARYRFVPGGGAPFNGPPSVTYGDGNGGTTHTPPPNPFQRYTGPGSTFDESFLRGQRNTEPGFNAGNIALLPPGPNGEMGPMTPGGSYGPYQSPVGPTPDNLPPISEPGGGRRRAAGSGPRPTGPSPDPEGGTFTTYGTPGGGTTTNPNGGAFPGGFQPNRPDFGMGPGIVPNYNGNNPNGGFAPMADPSGGFTTYYDPRTGGTTTTNPNGAGPGMTMTPAGPGGVPLTMPDGSQTGTGYGRRLSWGPGTSVDEQGNPYRMGPDGQRQYINRNTGAPMLNAPNSVPQTTPPAGGGGSGNSTTTTTVGQLSPAGDPPVPKEFEGINANVDYLDPIINDTMERVRREAMHAGSLTGATNSGGFVPGLTEELGRVGNQLAGVKGDKLFQAQQANADRLLQRLNFTDEYQLKAWMAKNDNFLKKYGIDQDVLLGRYQADSNERSAGMAAGATSAAAQYGADASRYNAMLDFLQGTYGIDRNYDANMGRLGYDFWNSGQQRAYDDMFNQRGYDLGVYGINRDVYGMDQAQQRYLMDLMWRMSPDARMGQPQLPGMFPYGG